MGGYGSHMSNNRERHEKLLHLVETKGYDHTMHHLVWLENKTGHPFYRADVAWLKHQSTNHSR